MRIFLRIFLGLIIAASLFNCSSGGGGGGGGDEPTQVETPVIDPAGGTVERYVDDVTITCATSGATIYYTDNGDDPTTDSLVYTDPIVLDTVGGITIKAFAAKSGSDDSGTAVADFTVEDTVGPSGTLTSAKATWYVDDILFTVTFNEPVTDFDDLADILVDSTNATVISIDGTLNPVFVVTVNPDDTETEADITISVPADVCTDDYAQSNTAVSSHTVHFNPDAVIAEITSSESSPTNTDPIPITITFNNDVENFDENDLVIGNGAVEGGSFAAVSASEYTANIVPSVTDDDVTVDIPEGVCNQLSGVTPNIASEQFSIRFDSEQPGVEITSTETDPSNADPIPLTITFTEAVGNFAVGDLDVVNGTAGDFTGTGDSYTVNITPDADGTVTVDIAEGTCNDAAGNLNTAATQFSIYSKTSQPSVLLETAESSPTNADTFSVTITFSEEVDFVEGDLTLGNCTSGNFDDTNNPVFTVDISPTADGTVTVDVAADVCADNYGNGNTAATQLSLTSDRTGPVATMDSVTGDPTNAASFTVTIDFDESTADFAADDITVSNGTKGTFGGTGTAYSIEITPDAAGLVTVDISVGVCTDALGNLNPAATQFARTVDWTAPDPPTVEQASGQNDPALVQPVLFTATFSEPVNFEAADVDLSGGTATGGTVTVTEITETTYEISVDGLTSAGDVVASIPVDAVQDLAGNNCPASTSTDNTVTFTGIIKGNT
ncbi:MAG: chitobiase/beta-hexosaminidase C-terminal domain-containing protein, partial [Spirochaetales bacterium]|nr:chitobiase/beta-hexosaminidase C-terminal domain-containing protein [Spirochaetales bacterium]